MNKKVILIADYYVNEINGGGEINNEELYNQLLKHSVATEKTKSNHVDVPFLKKNRDSFFIIFNFINLREDSKQFLQELDYCIYEHDHKYLVSRNPAVYDNFIAPKGELVNIPLYENARAVYCQSKMHSNIVKINTGLGNIVNLGGNLWSDEVLSILEDLSKKEKKAGYSVMNSPIAHKNTREAIFFCQHKGYKYDLIEKQPYYEFLQSLSRNEHLVFFPKTPETLSRIVVEARMMNMKIITNNLVGATSEEWFSEKGPALVDAMRNKKNEIVKKVFLSLEEVS